LLQANGHSAKNNANGAQGINYVKFLLHAKNVAAAALPDAG
jgi:hypothetical protein